MSLAFSVLLSACLASCFSPVPQAEPSTLEPSVVRIPRVSRPPRLDDFLVRVRRGTGVRITGFRQYEPGDGLPVSQETMAYLSYDSKHLFVAFVCRDEAGKIRARLCRREDIDSDDKVIVNLDTFHDHRHAYSFFCNPRGIQRDEIFTEGQTSDANFDTVWYSEGRLTPDGYVVFMAIPFNSLRFPRARMQTWGIALGRVIKRNKEFATWPWITQKVENYVQQLATLEGLEGISPPRNLQFIPYTAFSRQSFLDAPLGNGPDIRSSEVETRVGLDTKVVLHDAVTVDLTANPDFSHVESDEPQVTVNQRFEVFFPEKRPFFIENAGYFQTPVNLFFSRRIGDPQLGARVTGKLGPWSLGGLAVDDRLADSPVQSLAENASKATIGVVRLQRDFASTFTAGLLATARDSGESSNRILSLDARLNLSPNWVFTGQAIRSDTRQPVQPNSSGSAYLAELSHSGLHTVYSARYLDFSPDFKTVLGFVPRVDIREMKHSLRYYWKPKTGRVLLFGPDVSVLLNWNREGQLQDRVIDASFGADLRGPTGLGCRHVNAYELYQRLGFHRRSTDCGVMTGWLVWLELTLDYGWGTAVNYFPGPGLSPFPADQKLGKFSLALRPSPGLRFDQTYLYTGLVTRSFFGNSTVENPAIVHDHILRSKLHYQFTRALSARLILDYHAVLPNEQLVSLKRTKRVTGDVLLTFLLNPGTAIYAGYTDTYEDLGRVEAFQPVLDRTSSYYLSTGRIFFVKLSYLLRF